MSSETALGLCATLAYFGISILIGWRLIEGYKFKHPMFWLGLVMTIAGSPAIWWALKKIWEGFNVAWRYVL